MSESKVREDLLQRDVVHVHTVADEGNLYVGEGRPARSTSDQCGRNPLKRQIQRNATDSACHRASGAVDDIVSEAAPVGEAGQIARKLAHALTRGYWSSGNRSVQAEQIG